MANGKLNLGKQSGGVLSISFPDGATNTEVVLPESGNVVSIDGSVTDNAIARYDGTTGKLQNSGVIITDAGNLGVGTSSPNYKIHMVGDPSSNGVLRIEGGGTTTNDAVLDLTARGSNGAFNNAEIRALGSTASGTTLGFYTDNTDGSITKQMTLDSSGNLLLTSGTGALGYGAGAGGTVTQLTSKSTSVTLNKPCGQITMHNQALAADTSVYFAVYNSLVTPSDHIVLTMGGVTTNTRYTVFPTFSLNSGVFYIMVKNISAGSLSEALVVNFSIIKGAVS